jgi:hypothetical protein
VISAAGYPLAAKPLERDGIVYHYPRTTVPGRDAQEVSATKATKELGLPLFVVVQPGSSSRRIVHLGWVEDWDDEAELFLVTFAVAQPAGLPPAEDEDDAPFALERSSGSGSRVSVLSRPGQHRFSFRVLRRYGGQCAVCKVSVLGLLDAAHLRPYGHRGSDDPRNGLVLCATYHRAFDKRLFGIDPSTLQLSYREAAPGANALGITRSSLAHLRARPHPQALEWCWFDFQSNRGSQ